MCNLDGDGKVAVTLPVEQPIRCDARDMPGGSFQRRLTSLPLLLVTTAVVM